MSGPFEPLAQMARQLGNMGDLLGEDFWSQIRSACQAAQPAARATGAAATAAAAARAAAAPAYPPIEVYTTPTEVIVCAALPGVVVPHHVSATLAGPTELVLEAYVPPPGGGQGLILQRERVTGYLHRTVRLPAPAESASARARYRDGILEIRLVRAETGGGDGSVSLLRVEAPGPA